MNVKIHVKKFSMNLLKIKNFNYNKKYIKRN